MKIKEKYLRTINFEDVGKRKFKQLVHVSLFTGIGGFDLGFHQAGIETLAMVEWSKECCKTLRINWCEKEVRKRYDDLVSQKLINPKKQPFRKFFTLKQKCGEPKIYEEDITKIKGSRILKDIGLEVGELDCITGGPPCQGFSTAGLRMINDPRNKLYKSFVRLLKEMLPRFFVMENVQGMTNMANGQIMIQVCEDFARAGFNINWNLLDMCNYGVPQHRVRVILQGCRNDLLVITERGNPRYHIGCPGKVNHPAWFIKKYKLKGHEKLTRAEILESEAPRKSNEKNTR